jgi:hypothetical protein
MRVFAVFLTLLLLGSTNAQVVIQGKVVDVSSRKPLSGAKIQVDKQEALATTGADGAFEVKGIEPG